MRKNMLFVEDNGAKEIVSEVGLIVISVALLLVFRQTVGNLTNTLMNKATNQVDLLFTYTDATTPTTPTEK